MIAITRTLPTAPSIAETRSRTAEERWSPAAAAAFVLASSLALWALIIIAIRAAVG
ncbi:MAG TPA: hypothetical protein VFZ01_19950 [Geminicoccaceae bacterium]